MAWSWHENPTKSSLRSNKPPRNGLKDFLTGAKRREWMGLGVAGMIITSDEMDHSRKFPATSKVFLGIPLYLHFLRWSHGYQPGHFTGESQKRIPRRGARCDAGRG